MLLYTFTIAHLIELCALIIGIFSIGFTPYAMICRLFKALIILKVDNSGELCYLFIMSQLIPMTNDTFKTWKFVLSNGFSVNVYRFVARFTSHFNMFPF